MIHVHLPMYRMSLYLLLMFIILYKWAGWLKSITYLPSDVTSFLRHWYYAY